MEVHMWKRVTSIAFNSLDPKTKWFIHKTPMNIDIGWKQGLKQRFKSKEFRGQFSSNFGIWYVCSRFLLGHTIIKYRQISQKNIYFMCLSSHSHTSLWFTKGKFQESRLNQKQSKIFSNYKQKKRLEQPFLPEFLS